MRLSAGAHLGQYEILSSIGDGSVFATVTDWFEELRRRVPPKK